MSWFVARGRIYCHTQYGHSGGLRYSPSAPPMHKFLPESRQHIYIHTPAREKRRNPHKYLPLRGCIFLLSFFLYFSSFAKYVPQWRRADDDERRAIEYYKKPFKNIISASERASVFHRVIARRRRALSESGWEQREKRRTQNMLKSREFHAW